MIKNRKGQASLMIALMLMTFLFFFFFVVNIGMLVNAKINLQNAADLAAYAGASVQARQLDQISYLNYEMRRQYKKFLYRYYVIGNFQQSAFPQNESSNTSATRMRWSPDGSTPYPAPMVCIAFNGKDDYCKIAVQPAIAIPTGGLYDTINQALINQAEGFQDLLSQSCIQIGLMNQMILRFWLWNADPTLKTALQFYSGDQTIHNQIQLASGIMSGLGLLPREILLKMRIKTMNDYVNQPAQTDVTQSSLGSLISQNQQDPAAVERTVQAFYSAFYTLGNHNFPASGITMTELLPSQILQLDEIKARFDAYSVYFDPQITAQSPHGNACVGQLSAETLQNEATVGYYKDPSALTYYAIQLKANVRLLFSPWPNLTLKAYAAAQPFGSRIGPVLDNHAFVMQGIDFGGIQTATATGTVNNVFHGPTKQVPNLPIRKGDSPDQGKGWDTEEAMGTLFARTLATLPPSPNDPNQKSFDQAELDNFYQMAMVPNPWEEGNYNMINPNEYDAHFRNNFDAHEEDVFWAPILSPAKPPGDADAAIETELQNLIGTRTFDPKATAFLQNVKQELSEYMNSLRQGQGEATPGGTPESFNLVRIVDPFKTRPNPATGAPAQPISLPDWLMINEAHPEYFMTSWDSPSDTSIRNKTYGRSGYSVKFVTFDSLTHSKLPATSNANTTWSNDFPEDSEVSADMNGIKH